MSIKDHLKDIYFRIKACWSFYKVMSPNSGCRFFLIASKKEELHRFLEDNSLPDDVGVQITGNMSNYEIYALISKYDCPDEDDLILMKAMDQIEEEGYAE